MLDKLPVLIILARSSLLKLHQMKSNSGNFVEMLQEEEMPSGDFYISLRDWSWAGWDSRLCIIVNRLKSLVSCRVLIRGNEILVNL